MGEIFAKAEVVLRDNDSPLTICKLIVANCVRSI